jgi:hypothetical protein
METVDWAGARAIDERIAEMMEPRASLPRPTAHEARLRRWGQDPRRWTWYNVNGIDSPLGGWYAEIGSDCPVGDREPIEWVLNPDREPSDDIGAAWLVVERMRALGYLAGVYIPDDGAGWQAAFSNGDNDHGVRLADTAPLAICLAALATTEGSQTDAE